MFKDLRSYSKKTFLRDIGQGGIIAMTVLPLALAFGANSEIGLTPSLFTAIIIGGIFSFFAGGSVVFAPTCITFLIFSEILMKFGWATALISCFLAGVFLCISAILRRSQIGIEKNIPISIVQGFLLGATIDMAILQVTNYFEIGAKGATALEMLHSYKSVGFHSNWRTVLFATILLVVMITFPIKFKKLSKIVSAPFFGILITLLLNLFLNPDVEDSNVIEVGRLSLNVFNDSVFFFVGEALPTAQNVLICSFLLAFVIGCESFFCTQCQRKSNLAVLGVGNALSSLCTGTPLTASIKTKGTRLSGVFASIFMYAFILVFGKFLARLPISTLATILIVTTWNLIEWKKVKSLFDGNKIIKPLVFFATAVFAVLVDLTLVVSVIMIISVVLTFICKTNFKKNKNIQGGNNGNR